MNWFRSKKTPSIYVCNHCLVALRADELATHLCFLNIHFSKPTEKETIMSNVHATLSSTLSNQVGVEPPLVIQAGFIADPSAILHQAKQMAQSLDKEIIVQVSHKVPVYNTRSGYKEFTTLLVQYQIQVVGSFGRVVSTSFLCERTDMQLRIWDTTKTVDGESHPTAAR